MQAEAQEGFDEAAVAETLKAMPVPSDPSVNEVYTYVQKLRLVLNKVPRGSLPALCRRVVEATQQMLQHAPPAESQAIPANEMMKSTAMVCSPAPTSVNLLCTELLWDGWCHTRHTALRLWRDMRRVTRYSAFRA